MKQTSAKKQPPAAQEPLRRQPNVALSQSSTVKNGGRNASILTSSMIKKIDVSHSSDPNSSICPFEGYNTILLSSNKNQQEIGLDSSQTTPFVKDLVSSEVNAKCKILMERNNKLEEELRAYNTRMTQIEANFNTSLSEISSMSMRDLNNNCDDSMISLSDLSRQYDNVREDFTTLQAAVKTEIRSRIEEALREKDLEKLIDANNGKVDAKINLIEEQVRVYSNKSNQLQKEGSNSPSADNGIDSMTIKRIQADQLKVASDIKALKQELLVAKERTQKSISDQLETSMSTAKEQVDSIRQSVLAIKGEIKEKLNESMKKDQFDQYIDSLRRSVRELLVEREQATRLQNENQELEAQIAKYKSDTATQIEEMRRLVLSNPQIQMEASLMGFRQSSMSNNNNNNNDDYYDDNKIDEDYYQMRHSFAQNDHNDDDNDDMVEIATFGNDTQLQEDNDRFQNEITRQISFGDQSPAGDIAITVQPVEADKIQVDAEPQKETVQFHANIKDEEEVIVAEAKQQDTAVVAADEAEVVEEADYDQMEINHAGITDFFNQQHLLLPQQQDYSNRNSEIPFNTGTKHQNILADLGFSSPPKEEENVQGDEYEYHSPIKSVNQSPSRPAAPSFEQYIQMKKAENEEEQRDSHQERIEVKQVSQINVLDDEEVAIPADDEYHEKDVIVPAVKEAALIEPAKAVDEEGIVGNELQDEEDEDGVQLYFHTEQKPTVNELSTIQQIAQEASNFASNPSEIQLPTSVGEVEEIKALEKQGSVPIASAVQTQNQALVERNEDIPDEQMKQQKPDQIGYDLEDEESNKQRREEFDSSSSDDEPKQQEQSEQQQQQQQQQQLELSDSSASIIRNPIYESSNNDDDQEEIVYELDDDGYLIDENGNYILGDDGQMIKLMEEEIQYLKQTNILEEV